jgi:site-specific DNA-methyltransferase (adenine-specific)
VDLVYLDPPLNSNKDYNVFFLEHDGARAAAQVRAFKDTWEWDVAAARAYVEPVERGSKLCEAMQAFRLVLGETDTLAYLAMMAPRLAELRRVLKPTGASTCIATRPRATVSRSCLTRSSTRRNSGTK